MGLITCPEHGDQLWCLVSPDLLDNQENDRDVKLISFTFEGQHQLYAALSPSFATGQMIDLSRTAIAIEDGVDWYQRLQAMCGKCFKKRFPNL